MELNDFKNKLIPISPKLLRFARRLLENQEDARDSVQDVFLKLWIMRDKLETYKSLEALAMTMTKNACIDQLRKRKTFFQNEDSIVNRTDGTENVELMMTRKEGYNSVLEMITDLPEQQRAVIHLKDVEGYSAEEVMEILDINANTLRVNLSRARTKLRERIVQKNNVKWNAGR
jgi:RNA polymerase sigma factor (sigma-70 family)